MRVKNNMGILNAMNERFELTTSKVPYYGVRVLDSDALGRIKEHVKASDFKRPVRIADLDNDYIIPVKDLEHSAFSELHQYRMEQ